MKGKAGVIVRTRFGLDKIRECGELLYINSPSSYNGLLTKAT